jgi:hypothetical protein
VCARRWRRCITRHALLLLRLLHIPLLLFVVLLLCRRERACRCCWSSRRRRRGRMARRRTPGVHRSGGEANASGGADASCPPMRCVARRGLAGESTALRGCQRGGREQSKANGHESGSRGGSRREDDAPTKGGEHPTSRQKGCAPVRSFELAAVVCCWLLLLLLRTVEEQGSRWPWLDQRAAHRDAPQRTPTKGKRQNAYIAL